MDMMDVAAILQEVADKNAQMVELLQTKFAQDFQKVTANTVGDSNKTTIQRIDAAIAAMDTLIKSMGVYSTKTNSALAEIKKDLKEVHTGSGKDLSSDEITAVVTRRMKEWTVNKNENVLNYETKKAKSSESTQTIKKEFSEKITEKLDDCTTRLIEFFAGESDPDKVKKKNKSFIADLVTAIATNKAVGGIFEDLIKLVALFGASFLAQFGTIGKLVGAGLVMILPTLAPFLMSVIGQGLLKVGSTFLAPIAGPLVAAVAILGSVYALWKWWYDDKHKNRETPGGFIKDNVIPTKEEQKEAAAQAGYKVKNGKYSEEDWNKLINARVVNYDPNTGAIKDTALTTQENLFPALMTAQKIKPKTFDEMYDIIDLNAEGGLGQYFDKERGLKTSAINKDGDKFELVAGKEVKEMIPAYVKAAKRQGVNVFVEEAGLQSGGRAKDRYVNPYRLEGDWDSMNVQSGNAVAFGGYKKGGKDIDPYQLAQDIKLDMALHPNEYTDEEKAILSGMLGETDQYRGVTQKVDGRVTMAYTSPKLRSVMQKEAAAIDEAIRQEVVEKKGPADVRKAIMDYEQGEESQAQATSSDIYNLPELPKVKETSDYSGKEIQSTNYPLPGAASNVQQLNPNDIKFEEVSPPPSYKKADSKGIDVMGQSQLLASIVGINIKGSDSINGMGSINT